MGSFRPAHSYDEWTKLEEAVVGIGAGYKQHELDLSFKLFHLESVAPVLLIGSFRKPYVDIPRRIVDELEEDLEGLVDALSAFGTTVLRPVPPNRPAEEIKTPFWMAHATAALNIRDQTLILGDTLVETAPHVRARYFENDYLKPIFYRYFMAGSGWVSMPKPTLSRETLDPGFESATAYPVAALLENDSVGKMEGLGREMILDAAQCLRFGRDVIVNVANDNHQMGYDWLVRQFGERFHFHRVYRMAANHIDSIILPLRPGLMLLRSLRFKEFLPRFLQSWDVIYPPEISEDRFPDYTAFGFNLASKYIDMNVLSLDENTVVVNSLYPELITVLARKGMEVIPVRHRHGRLFSGGFHCFSLDCIRFGGCESYAH